MRAFQPTPDPWGSLEPQDGRPPTALATATPEPEPRPRPRVPRRRHSPFHLAAFLAVDAARMILFSAVADSLLRARGVRQAGGA